MKRNKAIFVLCVFALLFMGGYRYSPNSPKIDQQPVDGLLGVEGSLAYKVGTLNVHNHSRERWFGISGDQSGNDWATDTLTPFVAISGANDYGTDHTGGAGLVDEAFVIGTDDMPAISGMVHYDLHRILILDVDHSTVYKLRIVYGSVDRATSVSAGQYSEVTVLFDAVSPTISAGSAIEIRMPRLISGTDMVWIEAWNATDDSQIDFLVGVHEYEG